MNKETHDKDCELYGGFHACKCWLRTRGDHPAMADLREWYCQQHPEDAHSVDPLFDKLHEALHRIDREQEQLAARMR